MRLLMVIAFLIFAMPITGFGWAEGSNVLLDPILMCKKTRRMRGKLAEICHNNDTTLLKEIINGINMGFRECEYQFRNRQWNCTNARRSIRKILMKDTRESSFVNAITSAGITYAVTRACTMGTLVECSCDKNHYRRNSYNLNNNNNGGGTGGRIAQSKDVLSQRRNSIEDFSNLHNENPRQQRNNNVRRQQRLQQQTKLSTTAITTTTAVVHRRPATVNEKRMKLNQLRREKKFMKTLQIPDGDWEWGGCGDNVQFGFRKSKDFLDARHRRKRSDIRTMVKLHNNNAGRLMIRDNMRLECKCHGLSGSCTIKTCWLKMPTLREIGIRLKEKFDGSSKVIARNDGNSFMPEGPTIKPPTKYDLIYTDESPDFCRPNYKFGSLGTYGRQCNRTSDGIDGCALLCCNRGFNTRIINETINCKCEFKWCCEVKCSTCIEQRELSTCR